MHDSVNDYWVAAVLQPYRVVLEADCKRGRDYQKVQGISVRKGDGYAIVQWYVCKSSSDHGRLFKKEDIPPAVLFTEGAVIPVRIPGSMSDGSSTLGITLQTHNEIMLKLQLSS